MTEVDKEGYTKKEALKTREIKTQKVKMKIEKEKCSPPFIVL